jgi:hypothetical protein
MATNLNRIVDVLTELKDAGVLDTSAACQVDSTDQILDLGTGFMNADMVIDLTAIEVDTGDELYIIGWQLSSKADFADTIVEAVSLKMGDAAVLPGDADTAIGRYTVPVHNNYGGTVYRYARLFVTIAGTITPGGINFSAFLTKVGTGASGGTN